MSTAPTGVTTHELDMGRTDLGAAVAAEVQNPTNGAALYTVPSGKTFTGRIVITGRTDGTCKVNAATGGMLAGIAASSLAAALPPCEVDVVVAGGTGNAITVAVTGTVGFIGSVELVGYLK